MSKKFWQIRAAADEPKTGELLLYGDIADMPWWGDEVTPKQFKQDLDALGDIDLLNVYINSYGGDTFAGQAIYSMLVRHKAQVHAYVDGIAASAASIVAMAGDVIKMPTNSMMMIHNPWTIGIGYAADFRKIADMLDQVKLAIIEAYKRKCKKSDDEISAIMDAETWMTAEEAVEMGFADEVEAEKQVAASLNGRILNMNGQVLDLSKYRNPPKLLAVTAAKPEAQTNGQPKGLASSLVELAQAKKRRYA